MYTDFYNLKEKPFDLTPSSRFLYLGETHKEALALLTYGVVERKGFILLTGEVGTGKTTMIHALLDNLDENVQYIYITNPLLTQDDFIRYLARSIQLDTDRIKSKTEFLFEFESFLRQCRKERKNFILIVDEAQKLSFDLLEEIRLLSNMEDEEGKLINIFLVGQPEFNETLSEPDCRPLLQRISIRNHIKPLSQKSANEYILTRLRMAGLQNGLKLFSKDVIKSIFKYSDGYPRMINVLADNVLLLGYARGKDKITSSMVKECYDDLRLDDSFLKKTPSSKNISENKRSVESIIIRNRWVWAVIVFVVMGLSGFLIGEYGNVFFDRFKDYTTSNVSPLKDETSTETIESNEKAEPQTEDEKINKGVYDQAKDDSQEKKQIGSFTNTESKKEEYNLIQFQPEEVEAKPTGDLVTNPNEKVITVKNGDNLTELAIEIYGNANDKLLKLIRDHNPEIKNINFIEVGQKIIFPEPPESNKGQTYTVHVASFKPFSHAQQLFQRLIKEEFETYMIPVYDAKKGKLFRITLGNFQKKQEAQRYAKTITQEGISDYAQVIELESK